MLPETCNAGLLTIDGTPFPVRVVGSVDAATRQVPMRIEPCTGTTLHLRAGSHVIESRMNPRAGANATGFDLTRLTLVSGADGAASDATAFDLPSSDRAPRLRTTAETRSSSTLSVTGASAPYWLVLGQNSNPGWHARVDGKDLGPSRLVDGFANGWFVTPRRDGKPSVIELEWTPQRVVAFALGTSFIGLAACLTILVGGAVRRRRITIAGGPPPAPAPAPPAHLTGLRATTSLERRPVSTVLLSFGFGITSASLVRPWVGVVVAALAWWAARSPLGRTVVRWLPGVTITGVGLYIASAQLLEKYPPRFDWPTFFDTARIPTWIALFVFALDGVIGAVWRLEEEPADDPA
jgi:hypothetical protein